jgi:TolB-like protein
METASERPPEKPGWMAIALIAAFVLAAVAMYVIGARFVKGPTPSDLSSIGVRPFADRGSDPGNASFGGQFAQQLAGALAKVEGLHVVPPAGAGMIVEGSIRESGGRVYVTALLVPVGSRNALWAQSYECEASDVTRVEGEIVRGIAGAVHMHQP